VLPTGAGAEVGGEPTATADDDAGAGATVEVDRWSYGGTPSGTSEEHYRMELPQPGFLVRADGIVRDCDIADEL
jgi:hypothetical protein